MNEKLKPCPFCGAKGNVSYNLIHGYIPHCTNEFCMLNESEYGFETENEAIEAWNRRADDGNKF